ncbi:MAG: hypothetical protein JO356_20095 [Acidobacteria bacterium]|nr:hypothetical protein [Acidobacteriota bacterium]
MHSDLLEIHIIGDKETIAVLCDEVRSQGRMLVCHACGDVEALIAGLLIIEEENEAWALCGTCMRKVPLFGAVT